MMRALPLVLALAVATTAAAEDDFPRMRCASCSLLPAGATGSDLTVQQLTATSQVQVTGGGSFVSSGQGVSGISFGCGNNSGDFCFIRSNVGAAAATSTIPAFKFYHTNGALGAADLLADFGDNSVSLFTIDNAGSINAQGDGAFRGTNGAYNPGANNAGKMLLGDGAGSTATMADTSGGFNNDQVAIGGVVTVNTTAVGNLGASGPDDLQLFSFRANDLVGTGRCLDIVAVGTTANNANAKTVRLTIGATPTVLITKQLTASIAGVWKLTAHICRTGSSAQTYWAEAWNNGGTTVSSTDGPTVLYQSAFGTLTFTESSAQTIKTQSTASTTDNDIISQGLKIKWE